MEAGFTRREIVLIIVSLCAVVLAAWLWFQNVENEPFDQDITVDSFETCVEAGGSVMESFPRQCQAPDGQFFTEIIDDEDLTDYQEFTSEQGVILRIISPSEGERVESPLVVSGEVPGNWSFEGDFPLEIRGSDGEAIATTPATLQDDWMTEELVPFTATVSFPTQSSGSEGELVLIKDNPSGEAQLEDSVEIPIRF